MAYYVGLLKRVCKFEKNVPVALAAGLTPGKKDAYAEFATLRGYLEEKTGVRGLLNNDITADNRTFLTVRYSQDLFDELNNDANKALRVLVDDRKFTIVNWYKIKEKNFYIRLQLNEQR